MPVVLWTAPGNPSFSSALPTLSGAWIPTAKTKISTAVMEVFQVLRKYKMMAESRYCANFRLRFCSSHPCKEQHWHSGSDSSSPQAIPLINIHERDNVEIGDAYNINCGVLCLRISSSDKQHCDCSLAVAATETHTAHKRVLASDFTDYNESEFSCSHSARKCSADGKLILKCVVDHWVKLGSCPGGCYEPAPNFPTCNKPSTTEQRDDTPIGEDQARCKVRQTRCSPRRHNIVEKCFHGQWRPSKDCKKGHCVQEETRDATCVYTGGLESTFSTDTNCQQDQPCIQELDKGKSTSVIFS